MLFKKEAISALCAISSAIAMHGCQTIDSQIAATHKDCASFGFTPGSEAFKRCVARSLTPQDFHSERVDLEREQEQLDLQKEKLAYKKEKLRLHKADLNAQKRHLQNQRSPTVVVIPPSLSSAPYNRAYADSQQPAPYEGQKQNRSEAHYPRNSWEQSHDTWVRRKQNDIQVLRIDEVDADIERRRSEQRLLERSFRERRNLDMDAEGSSGYPYSYRSTD